MKEEKINQRVVENHFKFKQIYQQMMENEEQREWKKERNTKMNKRIAVESTLR